MDSLEDIEFRKALQEYRSKNEDLAYEAERSFDRYILSLASGALALSLTAVSTIFNFSYVSMPYLLFVSWMFFAVTVLATLGSFKFSSLCHRKIVYQIDSNSLLNEKGIGEPWNKTTIFLNQISLIFFILGLIVIFFFIGININNGKEVKNMKTTRTILEEGTTKIAPPDWKGTTRVNPPAQPSTPRSLQK